MEAPATCLRCLRHGSRSRIIPSSTSSLSAAAALSAPWPSRRYTHGANNTQPPPAAATATNTGRAPSITSPATRRAFSVLNRPPPSYPGHVPLTGIERAVLAAGAGLLSFLDPRRGDLIAVTGETAPGTRAALERLRRAMLASASGRQILRERPRITSQSLDLPRLRALPPNTLGAAYAAWLDREGVTPDTRAAVRYVDGVSGGEAAELAYVAQRYRESHDFLHALTGLPTVREGEVALKAFEFANTLLPMTGLATFAAATLKPAERARFWAVYGPWALRNGLRAGEVLCVYWERELESDIGELRARLGIEAPPDLRNIRKAEREERKRRRKAEEEAATAEAARGAA